MSIALRQVPSTLLTAVVNDATGSVAAVAAAPGFKILVWGVVLTLPTGHTVTFKSDTTALTGPLALLLLEWATPASANQQTDYAYPFLETEANEALNLVLDGAAQISGIVYYSLSAT